MKNSGGISIQMNYSALPRVVVSGPAGPASAGCWLDTQDCAHVVVSGPAAPASPGCWLETQDCAQACSAEEQVLTRCLGDWYEY